MYVTTGVRHSLGVAATWLIVAASAVGSVVWYQELKGVAAAVLGVPELQEQTENLKRMIAASDPASVSGAGNLVELKAGENGHFHTEAGINGRTVEVLVDTGASMVALTWEDAQTAGINVRATDFTGTTMTANGKGKFAPVTIERVSIGEITVHNVRGAVMERGKLSTTLLGMSFLGKLSRAEMRRDTLVLEQ
jgi:aspartyl protease family protein